MSGHKISSWKRNRKIKIVGTKEGIKVYKLGVDQEEIKIDSDFYIRTNLSKLDTNIPSITGYFLGSEVGDYPKEVAEKIDIFNIKSLDNYALILYNKEKDELLGY